MPNYTSYYEARNFITDIVKKDIVGPVKDDEVIGEFPVQYYAMGKLYPQPKEESKTDVLLKNDTASEDDNILENDSFTDDSCVSLSNQNKPSSMGITITLKEDVRSFVISGKFAQYKILSDEEAKKYQQNEQEEKATKKQIFWQRQAYKYEETFSLANGMNDRIIKDTKLKIHVHCHKPRNDITGRVITVALVNTDITDEHLKSISEKTYYQVETKISGIDETPIFLDVNHQKALSTDAELQELDLLYSDTLCYAQGHGCSVTWDLEHEEPLWVSSAFMPSFELRLMKPGEIRNKKILSMKFLATADAADIINDLHEFLQEYNDWISETEKQAQQLSDTKKDAASKNIQKCKNTLERLKQSVTLLKDDRTGNAFKAFQYANEAMLLQRKQSFIKKKKDYNEDEICWYPFQLAFLLQELPSFIEPDSDERKKVDLLWFPTGGGKTEAYLGISAFAIFYRRLKNPDDDGVTVIMRYTLRLLTLQQFERASMLIFACDQLRQKYDIGKKEIAIGLWVGGKLTPNNFKNAANNLSKCKNTNPVRDANPCQIKVCPWCGTSIVPANYVIDKNPTKMIIRCPNTGCTYNKGDGLPVHIIDEAIYKNLPAFIVATVDKFAQLPLKDEPSLLFGLKKGERIKNPPELIIQDELHLISGPLGTITGIYEGAIMELCKKDNRPVKIIASTATIRNASKQICSLYGRKHTQFPPQGITAKDSFFAVESTSKERPTRQYMGILGTGTTSTTTLIRLFAVLLFATRHLAAEEKYTDAVIDSFWTLVGYFNTLKELGGATTQILDAVQSRYNFLRDTKFKYLNTKIDRNHLYNYFKELTSRMGSDEVTKVIQEELIRPFSRKNCDAFDFLLASNMISVGVDVDRLGTMVVVGQPKSNAEYIQATSRVGRSSPGLVIVVYQGRSRDRSHYEQFLKYHQSLYRYVEATSLTPFADRARDRGLQALYVTLCRHLIPTLAGNEGAAHFNEEEVQDKLGNIASTILSYVDIVDENEKQSVEYELGMIRNEWQDRVTANLVYKNYAVNNPSVSLLKADIEADRFSTMNSMRNIEGMSNIYILKNSEE